MVFVYISALNMEVLYWTMCIYVVHFLIFERLVDTWNSSVGGFCLKELIDRKPAWILEDAAGAF